MAHSVINDLRQKFRSSNPVTQLILANVIVFFILGIVTILTLLSGRSGPLIAFSDFLFDNLALPLSFRGLLHKPWTLITYMFTHIGFMHIFWNMLTLYWFGQILSGYTSPRKIVPLYLLGGIAGGLASILLVRIVPALQGDLGLPLIGASAGVTAIITGAATLVPEVRINLLLIGPVKLVYVALIVIFIDVLDVAQYVNVGGNLAHLGGALMGYLFIVQYKKGRDMSKPFSSVFDWLRGLFTGSKSNMKVIHKRNLTDEEYNHNRNVTQKQVDAILDKISKSGYESLSKTEKEILFNESRKK